MVIILTALDDPQVIGDRGLIVVVACPQVDESGGGVGPVPL